MKKEVCPLCNAVVEVYSSGKLERHRPRWRDASQLKAATCFGSGRTMREVIAKIADFDTATAAH